MRTGTSLLLIRIPGQAEQRVALEKAMYTIGRWPDNDIVLSPDYVSGRHGRLERRGRAWYYTDLDSTNGTFVNGRLARSAELHDGDILRIGDPLGNSVSLTLRESAVVEAPAYSTIRIGTTALGLKPSLIIGRDPQADIPLQAPVVSWRHARLDRTAQGFVLTDLNSTNGTFVNGRRVTAPCIIKQGDVIQIGPFRLVWEAAGLQQYAVTGGVRLDGIGLRREVGPKARRKCILHDVSISIYPREFVALVGTSGAGKSTLMMALNGFVRAQKGQVLINGDDLYRHFDLYRTMVGYVPQDDIIHRELTVANALRYAARLRLPPDTSAEEIEKRIDEVLQQVEMLGQKDQLVSSLSGGQRKRVSIAVELLAEPKLFFLDEPTSGLDPGLEKKMMHTLRRLADGGRTVILVTHATSNISQCDHVCFLSQGRLVYFGPPHEAFQFFNVPGNDFADIYDRLDDLDPRQARQKAYMWEQRFRQSQQYQRYVVARQKMLPEISQKDYRAPARRQARANPFLQFITLTRRYLELVLHDKLLLTVLLAVMPAIGLLLLLITKSNWLVGDSEAEIMRQLQAKLAPGGKNATYAVVGNAQTLLFMLALAAVLLGLFAAAYEIVKERPIYLRERMVNLRLVPYLFSKVSVLGAFALVQCMLLLLVVCLKVKMPADGVLMPAMLEMYLTLLIGAIASIMLGLLISALVPNTNTVIYAMLILLFLQIIFAGVVFDLPPAADRLSVLTLTRWTMEGLGVSANMEYLNSLTRTSFQPDPVTQVISYTVEKPAENWKPVEVVTVTETIPVTVQPGIVQTVPISVPKVIQHEMVTTTEVVTHSETITPELQVIYSKREFDIDYTRSARHLACDWLIMIIFGVASGVGTIIVLRSKDVR